MPFSHTKQNFSWNFLALNGKPYTCKLVEARASIFASSFACLRMFWHFLGLALLNTLILNMFPVDRGIRRTPPPLLEAQKKDWYISLGQANYFSAPLQKKNIYIYWACKAGWIRWPSFARSGLLERPLTKVITAATLSKNRGLDDCETGQAVRSSTIESSSCAMWVSAGCQRVGSSSQLVATKLRRIWDPPGWKKMKWKPPDPGLSASTAAPEAAKNRCCCRGKTEISFQFKAHNCFDHLEACFNLRCHSRYRLILSSFNGHGTTIAYSAVNALFQEVGDTVQLWGCATCGLPSCPGMEDDVLDLWWRRALAQNLTKPVLLMLTRSCVRPKNVPVFCMGCFLSAANGEPIKVHSWFTAHCPGKGGPASPCCLNSRNAAAWRMLASVVAGMSIPGRLRSIRGQPSQYTRSPLE